ncbi:hypothetical protein ACFPPD_19140 [Cohnella suwonensis]|uniref:ABC transmembrane type-1 domain-containing protein n=1 Tax=Cohnella suwonensis TaxID=696072 RepID=A0ABW0M0J6_9BACL
MEKSAPSPLSPSRLRQYGIHGLIVLPAIALLLAFKFIPFLMNVKLAFSKSSFSVGILNGQWTGWDNFRTLFETPEFKTALANTLILKFGYAAFCGLLAFGIAILLAGIRSAKWRGALSTILLIPYFIPSLVIAYVVMTLLSIDHSPLFSIRSYPLADTFWFRPIIVVAETVRTCGIPIVIALAAIGAGDESSSYARRVVVPAAKAIAAFLILQLSTALSTDFEMLFQLYNPLVYSVGDTLDTYQFRTGMMMGDINGQAAVSMLQFIVQLAFTLLAYALAKRFFLKDLFPVTPITKEAATAIPRPRGAGLPNIVVTGLFALVALLPLYVLFVFPFLSSGESSGTIAIGDMISVRSFAVYWPMYIFMSVCGMLVVLTLSYPLTARDLPGRTAYIAFLLLAMTMGGSGIADYIFVRELGAINTIFSQMIFGYFPIVSAFVLKSIFNSKYGALKEQASNEGQSELQLFFSMYIPKVWKPLLALGLLQFVALWNTYIPSLLYLNDPNLYSPVARLLVLIRSSAESGGVQDYQSLLLYAGIVCLPPIVLFLALRKLFTSEVFLSQIRKL